MGSFKGHMWRERHVSPAREARRIVDTSMSCHIVAATCLSCHLGVQPPELPREATIQRVWGISP